MKASHRREDFTAYQRVLHERRVHTGVSAKQMLHPPEWNDSSNGSIGDWSDPNRSFTACFIEPLIAKFEDIESSAVPMALKHCNWIVAGTITIGRTLTKL